MGLLAASGVLLFLTYSAIAVVITGVGLLLLPRGWLTSNGPFDAFWVGSVALTSALLAAHLLIPLRARLAIPIVLVGLFGWLQAWRRGGPPQRWPDPRLLVIVALVGVATGCVAAQGNLVYDHGLYHAQTIKWWSAHPAVPGLGNLHGRLAFNNSSFAIPSVLHGLIPIPVRHVALGAPALVLMAELIARLLGRHRREARVGRWVAGLLIAPLCLWLVQRGGSVSPDLAVFMFEAVIGLRLVDMAMAGGKRRTDVFGPLAVLSFGLVTIKLSAALFAAAMLAIAWLWLPREQRQRTLVRASGLGLMVLAPWTAHGMVQSGYPVYPVALVGLPVDWRVPQVDVESLASTVGEWAWSNLHRYASDWLLLLPIVAAVIAAFVVVRKPPRTLVQIIVILALLTAGTAALAPDPRFVGATPWLVGGVALSLAGSHGTRENRPLHLGVLVIAGAVVLLPFASAVRAYSWIQTEPLPPPESTDLRTVRLADGLEVHVPIEGDRVFWAPLPSAPSASLPDGLRRRDPSDLASGFAITTDVPPPASSNRHDTGP